MNPAGELVELEATRDLLRAAPLSVVRRGRVAFEQTEGVCCMAVGALSDIPMFNRVAGLGVERPATQAVIDAASAFFARAGVRFLVPLWPGAQPSAIADWLRSHGFENGYAWAKFRRGSGPFEAGATGLRVEEAGPERGVDLGAVVAEGYGLPGFVADWVAALCGRPGWHCFLALDGGQPAGAGALYVSGRTGWLGLGAVHPDHRGKGAQRALFAARFRAAAACGCELLVTETGVPMEGRPSFSYWNILAAGFEVAYVRPNYVSASP